MYVDMVTVHEYRIYSVSWKVANIVDRSLEFIKQVAWFAVGCYYLLVGKNDPARRYFRCVLLNFYLISRLYFLILYH